MEVLISLEVDIVWRIGRSVYNLSGFEKTVV